MGCEGTAKFWLNFGKQIPTLLPFSLNKEENIYTCYILISDKEHKVVLSNMEYSA